jgi:hypothetical protein
MCSKSITVVQRSLAVECRLACGPNKMRLICLEVAHGAIVT